MPMLDACLAFALTMLSLATLATLATEITMRLMGTRASGLRMMLDDLYEHQLLPALKDNAVKVSDDLKQEFSSTLQKSPLADLPNNTFWNFILKTTAGYLGLTKLTNLHFDEFLKRLPDTELGKKLVQLEKTQRKALFDRLSHRYEEFGKAVTDLFSRYAQLFSLIVGIGIAFAMNVDSFRLFAAFQNDAALRGRVVATSDEILSNWEQAQKQADKRRQEAVAAATALTEKQQAKAKDDELKAEQKLFSDQWKKANSLDLPIGYDHFERWTPGPVTKYIPFTHIECDRVWFYFYWAVRVIISGLLIGLGGPFWYNIATKLMAVTQSVRRGPAGTATTPPTDDSGSKAMSRSLTARGVAPGAAATPDPAHDLFMKFARQDTNPNGETEQNSA